MVNEPEKYHPLKKKTIKIPEKAPWIAKQDPNQQNHNNMKVCFKHNKQHLESITHTEKRPPLGTKKRRLRLTKT